MKNLTATLVFTSALAFSPSLYAGSCGGGDHTHSAQEKAMSIFNKADNNSDGFINAGARFCREPGFGRRCGGLLFGARA